MQCPPRGRASLAKAAWLSSPRAFSCFGLGAHATSGRNVRFALAAEGSGDSRPFDGKPAGEHVAGSEAASREEWHAFARFGWEE
jgi:hypothetical protein